MQQKTKERGKKTERKVKRTAKRSRDSERAKYKEKYIKAIFPKVIVPIQMPKRERKRIEAHLGSATTPFNRSVERRLKHEEGRFRCLKRSRRPEDQRLLLDLNRTVS